MFIFFVIYNGYFFYLRKPFSIKLKKRNKYIFEHFPNTKIFSQIPLRIFGCTVFIQNHQPNKSKLNPKAIKCIFLGNASNQEGYKCYNPASKKFHVSMNVSFFENQPYFSNDSRTKETNDGSFQQEIDETFTEESQLYDTSIQNLNINDQKTQKSNQHLVVYTRKRTNMGSLNTPKEHVLEQAPIESMETPTINTNPPTDTQFDDHDLAIAKRKGVRVCTKQPIQNYLSYKCLSHKFQAFTANLS